MATKVRPPTSNRTSIASRVVPAISLTITRSSPASAFVKELLPALRRPTIATFISVGTGLAGASPTRSQIASRRRRRPEPLFALTMCGSPKPRRIASKAWASHDGPSTLFTTSIALAAWPLRRSIVAIVSSSAVTPLCASTVKRITSASSVAARICSSMCGVSAAKSMPASSMRPPSAV